jgi:uncharacterized protein YecE (DUF72 family)
MRQGRLYAGTSGWSYRSWRGDFYPDGLPHPRELEYLAERVTSTEINASFYRLQSPASYRRWRDRTTPGHLLAVKGSRYVTHVRRLREPETALANLIASGVLTLGSRRGPMLWQLPANLPFDRAVLRSFLATLPGDGDAARRLAAGHDDRVREPDLSAPEGAETWRHALEPRHPSFAEDEVADLLAEHQVAMVWSDGAGSWPVFDRDTADFRYVRLHGHTELYASRYADRTLDQWAERCRQWMRRGQDVHVYFDNDIRGHAPYDAVRLLRKVSEE